VIDQLTLDAPGHNDVGNPLPSLVNTCDWFEQAGIAWPWIVAGSCTWCGGSGTWTDPDGKGWTCIKCGGTGNS